ncbi:MAG: serine hydrolase [Chlamydiales bacterium]|nr:serine hydrolase [Chlamydiales bacterium]
MVFRKLATVLFPFVICVGSSTSAYASLSNWFSSFTAEASAARNRLEGFDILVENALKDYEVPGVAIGIVVDGQVIYSKGFGYRDLEAKKPITPDTLFAIGSCTKAFTSFLAGTLVDEGILDWDANVVDILPSFRLYDSYATQHMTIRDLLTHRSGMPRHDYMWYNSKLSRSELMQRLRYLEPASQLRERFHYNNLMYLAAGYLMEQLTQKSWETLVSERIFAPLEMTKSNFSVEEMQKSDDHASPYLQKNDQLIRMSLRDISVIGPAGSINSNVQEMTNWIKMQLDQGAYNKTPLINPATLQEMHSPQVVVSGTPEHKEAVLSTYGIGWGVLSYRGHYHVSHDGGDDGFVSVVTLLPNEKIGVVILSNKNLTTLPRFLCAEIIDRLLDLPPLNWYGEGLDSYLKTKTAQKQLQEQEYLSRKKNTTPSHPLQDYVGQFEHPGYGLVDITSVNGQLNLTFNHITSTLNHWHYDMFVVSEESEDLYFSRIGTKITFQMNDHGEIETIAIPFEPGTGDILFKKKPSNQFESTAYLQRFTGFYQFYDMTIQIAIKGHNLVAIIPGQPLFELLPHTENTFTVKSKTGYTVRFTLDENQAVQELLLIQPYGAFSAKPKKT